MKKWAYFLIIPALFIFLLLFATYEKWHALDAKAAQWLYGNEIIELFHYFGETWLVIGIGLLLMVLFLIQKRASFAVLVFITIAGNFGVNQLMKAIVERPRPNVAGQLVSYSFPSGHTMASLTLLMLLAYLLTHYIKHKVTVRLIYVTAILLAVGTGLSRIAGGRHFLTDVVAGWGLAYAWVVCIIYLYETRVRKVE